MVGVINSYYLLVDQQLQNRDAVQVGGVAWQHFEK